MALPRRNIEAKYRCDDLLAVLGRAKSLGAKDAGVVRQSDRFFEATFGRLKLRQIGDGRAELISYVRQDVAAAKGSDYCIYHTAAPEELAGVLAHCLESRGVVQKARTLLLWRNTRIHLDEVDGLGTFVELETVIHEQNEHSARDELKQIAGALVLSDEDLMSEAYIDLLAAAKST